MKIISNLIFAIFMFLIVFTRSFAGLYIFGYRIGEYLVAGGLVLFIYYVVLPQREQFPEEILSLTKYLFLSFLIVNFFTYTDMFDKFTYKNSSYLWTIAFMFVGFVFFGNFFNRNKFYVLVIGIIVIYIFGTGSYPDILQNLFRTYGDKFTFVKASDMLLAIVVSNIIALNLFTRNLANLYFILSVTSFSPLLIQMSRGTAVALSIFAALYILFNLSFYFKFKNLLILILLTPLVFIASTFRVTQYDFSDISIDELETVAIQSSSEVDKIKRVDNRNTDEIDPFWSFYISEGRLISTDGTFNWRLNIWQDQNEYQRSLNKSLFGYGYNVLLPVFDLQVESQNIWNIGHDQQNRHVHNYLVNVYSRGGVFQLILIIGFHLGVYFYYYKKFNNHHILLMLIPLMFNSMTDITMEGVQFPINFYLIYGYILSSGIKSYKRVEVS